MSKHGKNDPRWSVTDRNGKVMVGEFSKMRLARRAAQRLMLEGGQPYFLVNMHSGEKVRFEPYVKEAPRVQINMTPQEAPTPVGIDLVDSVHKRTPDTGNLPAE